jgi:hypothetical protein
MTQTVGRLVKIIRRIGEFKLTTGQSNLSEKVDRHSIFGIASFVSGLLALLFLLIGFGEVYSLIYLDPEGKTIFLSSDLYLPAIILALLVGVVLGFVGLFQKHRKKTMAIIGLILCLITGILSCLSFAALFSGMVILGLSGV